MSMQSALDALNNAPVTAPTSPVVGIKGSPSDSSLQSAPTPSTSAKDALVGAVKPQIEASKPAAPRQDQFAALAKRERAIQKQIAELKAKEAKVAEWEKIKTTATSNPVEALKAIGLTYEQITQFLLNGNKPTPELEIAAVKGEVEKLKQEQLLREQAAKDAQKQSAEREYQQTLEDFNGEIGAYLSENKGEYELTNMYEGQSIVLSVIEQHFATNKKIMSIKEASDLVEQYFEEQVNAAQKTKKFQAKQQPKEVKGQSDREGASKSSTPTLSNGLTSSAPSMLPAKTERDRMNRALAALDK